VENTVRGMSIVSATMVNAPVALTIDSLDIVRNLLPRCSAARLTQRSGAIRQ
jgi:hypothetical protein